MEVANLGACELYADRSDIYVGYQKTCKKREREKESLDRTSGSGAREREKKKKSECKRKEV